MNRFIREPVFLYKINPLTPKHIGAHNYYYNLYVVLLALLIRVAYLAVTNFKTPNHPKSSFMKRSSTSSINMFRLKKLAGITLVCCMFVVGLVV
jgi:hypothetical protein